MTGADLVQMGGVAEMFLIDVDTLSIEQDNIPDGGRSDVLEDEVELPLRMRCINSMPEIVVAALLNRLNPSITFLMDLM